MNIVAGAIEAGSVASFSGRSQGVDLHSLVAKKSGPIHGALPLLTLVTFFAGAYKISPAPKPGVPE